VDVILAPDVYVNASVAPQSLPDQVVQRILGQHKGEGSTSAWILDRAAAMLVTLPNFKEEAVKAQMELIKTFVNVVEVPGDHGPDAWEGALVAAAEAAGAKRVITDHPDLVGKDHDSVEFISSEAWLFEQKMPPPPPGT